MLSFVNSLTGRTTVSTASILFFPSLLPILYTLSFSFLPAPPRRKNTEKLQTDEILSRVLCKTCFLTSKKNQNTNNSKEVTPVFFFPPLFLHRPLLFTVVSSCSMELPSSRSRRISAHLLSREEMRKNVVQRSKSLLGQGDLLWEARHAYVDEKLHKLTTRKGGRARWSKDARVCADKTT